MPKAEQTIKEEIIKIVSGPVWYFSLSKEGERKLDKIIEKWFEEFMVDKIIRRDVRRITCLEELKLRIKKMLKEFN